MSESPQAFQVDLRGVVDLFSRHLYSGPRVYVRELLQNAVDAITARRAVDPDAPGTVRVTFGPGSTVQVRDVGIGLTAAEARDVLATIGRSSKRDMELGVGRGEYLGQFGIGLLSAFMVAESVEVVSRSARDLDAKPIRWRGLDDGRYTLDEIDEPVEPGTTVRLAARRDAENWVAPEVVVDLMEEFGGLLPVDVQAEVTTPAGATLWRRTSRPTLPWTVGDRNEYCRETFGFTPLATIDLSVPLAGLSGVGFVLPAAPPPGPGVHRVYLKRMLLGTRVETLLPDWAFFVRCVIDADQLRPTASREALYEDEILLAVRDQLSAQIRDWVAATVTSQSTEGRRFVETHHLALRAMARTDDQMLDLVAKVLPFETTDGPRTLAEIHEDHQQILFTASVEEYRRVSSVARAQSMVVVNAGYVYDTEIMSRLATRKAGWTVRPLSTQDVSAVLTELDWDMALQVEEARADADRLLADHDCEVVLRTFEPASLPAMLLTDRDAAHQLAAERTRAEGDDVWGAAIGDVVAPRARSRRLVLNAANDAVISLLATEPGRRREAGLHAVYVSAVLLAGEPVRAVESTMLSEALASLLQKDER